MFEKFIDALTPFALAVFILGGASLTGWVKFTNNYVVGIVVVLLGAILVASYVLKRTTSK